MRICQFYAIFLVYAACEIVLVAWQKTVFGTVVKPVLHCNMGFVACWKRLYRIIVLQSICISLCKLLIYSMLCVIRKKPCSLVINVFFL